MGTTVKAALAFFILVGGIAAAGSTTAQNYPNKPLRIIVAAASGSAPDISARNLANELGLQLSQQIVVDNRPGASGIIGFETIARAEPDGYTFGYIQSVFAANPSMYLKLPYDSARDFQPIILFASIPSLLAVTPALPIRSVKELIEQARAKPGSLSFGGTGYGSPQYLSVELLRDLEITKVPF